MTSRLALSAALAGALSLFAAGAQAAVVFGQALAPAGGSFISDERHTITYDNFVLAEDTLVTGLEWWGTAKNYPGWLGPPLPNPMPVAIEFYESAYVNSGGRDYAYPDLDAGLIHGVEGYAAWTEVARDSKGDAIQHYTFTFDEAVRLDADRTLWLTVYATSNDIANAVFWRQSGPGSHWTESRAELVMKPTPKLKLWVGAAHTNAAFTLFGTAAVPEPSAWALMIAGFAAAGAALRSQRRAALRPSGPDSIRSQ